MTPTVLGIDISKKDFYVSLMTETRATKPRKFTNNIQGFESLHNWLKQLSCSRTPRKHMEVTSIYGEALAEFLYGEGFQVSIVNPARIKGFAKSELLRTKTDSVDAAPIATSFLCGNETIIMDTNRARSQGITSPITATRISHRNDDLRTKPFGDSYANSCCSYPGTQASISNSNNN